MPVGYFLQKSVNFFHFLSFLLFPAFSCFPCLTVEKASFSSMNTDFIVANGLYTGLDVCWFAEGGKKNELIGEWLFHIDSVMSFPVLLSFTKSAVADRLSTLIFSPSRLEASCLSDSKLCYTMSIAMLYDEYSYAELSVPSRYTFLVPFFKSLYNISRIDVSSLCIWRMNRNGEWSGMNLPETGIRRGCAF